MRNDTRRNPLSKLDDAGFNYTNYTYPADLGTPGAGKDHYMVFHINQTAMSAQNFTVPNLSKKDLGTSTLDAHRQQDRVYNSVTKTDPQKTPVGNNGTVIPTTIEALRRPTSRVATTIVLYMPRSLGASYGAKWAEAQLGVGGDLAKAAIDGSSWADVLASGGVSAVSNTAASLDSLTGLNLSDTISSATRLAINNHPEVIFEGMDFRGFTFEFRFAPQTEAEAQNVNNIITAFKFHAAPDVVKGTAGRFWIYPDEFDIEYYSNGEENLFLNRISTCALTEIEVNYTPHGHWQAFRQHSTVQGAPSVCTDLRLTFRELEIMTKRLVNSGY